MGSFFLHYLTLWRPLGYALIFLGLCVEGETVLFIAAFLTYQGFFHLTDMLIVAFAGTLTGDAFWYLIGKRIRPESLIGRWIHKMTAPFDEHLRKRPLHTIFISKFTYGFNRALQMRAGSIGISPKVYSEADGLSALLWVLIVGGLGFAFGASFLALKAYFRFAELALLIAVLVFVVGWHFIAGSMKKRL